MGKKYKNIIIIGLMIVTFLYFFPVKFVKILKNNNVDINSVIFEKIVHFPIDIDGSVDEIVFNLKDEREIVTYLNKLTIRKNLETIKYKITNMIYITKDIYVFYLISDGKRTEITLYLDGYIQFKGYLYKIL